MNIKEKLVLVQRLSGLTQEKLALKLGVSFATLNSWINQRSLPRKEAQSKIDDIYRIYTGQKIIPTDILDAKKEIIQKKAETAGKVLTSILKNPDIYDQFMLSLTYNSNRIEGSTLTEPETAAVLFDNVSLPNKSLIEQLEVKNHQAALGSLLKTFSHRIDEALILKWHAMLMNGIKEDAGMYRRHPVRIVGANIPTANYLKIPTLMNELIKMISHDPKDSVRHISMVHSQFEKIHPFSDGNGRIGRLLMHAMALKNNFPPPVIKQEHKRLYYAYLNKAQQSEDSSLLEDFVCDAILEGFQIMERK